MDGRPFCSRDGRVKQQSKTARLEFLGTGTSTGVPVVGCTCAVCRSNNPHDKRYRSSVLISNGRRNLVIDTGPDFRSQCLRANLRNVHAVCFTHEHVDHMNGFDEVRCFSFFKNKTMPVFGSQKSLDALRVRFAYIWNAVQFGGGLPDVDLHTIDGPFQAAGMTITPIPLFHGILPILGYRIGDLAYMTDISDLPESSLPLLDNLTTMVISCVRHRPHRTHLNLSGAKQLHKLVKPKQTLLTHLTHYLSHKEWIAALPDGMLPAYDGMKIDIALD